MPCDYCGRTVWSDRKYFKEPTTGFRLLLCRDEDACGNPTAEQLAALADRLQTTYLCDYCGGPAVYRELYWEDPAFGRSLLRGLNKPMRLVPSTGRSGFVCAADVEPGQEYKLQPIGLI